MRRKKLIIGILAVFLLASCVEKPKSAEDSSTNKTVEQADMKGNNDNEVVSKERIFFKAHGNEPFWSVALTGETLVYTSLNSNSDTVTARVSDKIRAADTNLVLYRAQKDSLNFELSIHQGECADTMADTTFSYRVRLNILPKNNEDRIELQGCGSYQTDAALQGTWEVDEAENGWYDATKSNTESPLITIDIRENTISGNAGCNQFQGKVFWEPGRLRFTDIATTRKMCPDMSNEEGFLNRLSTITSYEFREDKLFLNTPEGVILVLKK